MQASMSELMVKAIGRTSAISLSLCCNVTKSYVVMRSRLFSTVTRKTRESYLSLLSSRSAAFTFLRSFVTTGKFVLLLIEIARITVEANLCQLQSRRISSRSPSSKRCEAPQKRGNTFLCSFIRTRGEISLPC